MGRRIIRKSRARIGNGSVLNCWATSRGHRLTVAGTIDGHLLVWDPQTNKQIGTYEAHPHQNISQAIFDDRGRYLATATIAGEIKVWDTSTWESVTMDGKHRAPLTSLQFSPDRKTLVSASFDKTAKLWDTRSGKPKATLPHDNLVFMARFSPDGSQVATASEDSSARIWDAQTGKALVPRLLHGAGLKDIFFRGHRDRLLTVSFSGLLWGWEIRAPFTPQLPLEFGKGITMTKFLGGQIVGAGKFGQVGLWDSTSGKNIVIKKPHDGPVFDLAITRDETHFATTSYDQTVAIFKPEMTETVVLEHPVQVRTLAFHPEGQLLLTGARDGSARVWDWSSEKLLFSTPEQEGEVSTTSFTPDGKHFLTAGRYQVALWDSTSGAAVAGPRLYAGIVSNAALAPDRKKIAIFHPRSVGVFDRETLSQEKEFQRASQVMSHAFSRDGSELLIGCSEGSAFLYHWAGQADASPHQSFVLGNAVSVVCFSRDGSVVFTGARDGRYRLWDKKSGKPVTSVHYHPGGITGAAFTPKDKAVLITSREGAAALVPLVSAPSLSKEELADFTSLMTKTRINEKGKLLPFQWLNYGKSRTNWKANNSSPLIQYLLTGKR